MQGLVFSIEEFSVFDGPGIRTTVFLKGCPLHCEWCHNPEGKGIRNEIIRSPNGCLHCGGCEAAAEMINGKMCYTEKSISVCPNHLLRYCAAEYTAAQLVEKITKNLCFLNPDGGITFSGGEPLLQHLFLDECLTLLHGKTNRAIQTSGYAPASVFSKILSNTDYMLFDLKLIKERAHLKYTGMSNKVILQNFKTLCESGVPFVVRTPLIPGVTDTAENLTDIAGVLRQHGVPSIELLPYHTMTGSKYALVGEKYAPSFDGNAACHARTELFEAYGITAKII